MNNNIQCSIESSTTKIELNSAVEGVFLVPELEGLAGLPEIRTTSGVNAGYDGGWTSAQNYDARLISIRGVIANPDISKVEDKRRAIASLLGQGRKEQLTLRFTTEAGNAYAISVRTISCEMALQRVLTTQEFLIQLRADDPLIYDDGATGGIAAILQPQRALGGFEINFDLPLAIGGGAEDTVVDNGNETVYPVIKLYGALHSPTVVNRTTNQQIQILADLQYSIDWHTYRSTTGDYILVNGGLDGAPMTLSQLLGNAEQTTYSGKNLARPNGNNTAAGVSFVWNSDGTITLNGTATAAIDIWVANGGSGATEFTIPTGTKLTQSFRVVSGSASANTWAVRTNLYYGGVSHWVDVVGNTTFTATSETQVRGLEVLAPSGLTFNNLRLEIQLEKSATATTWEKYVGGIPAPNPQFPQPISTVTGAQNIKVVGKNLLNIDFTSTTSAGITITNNGNGTITVSGTTTGAAGYNLSPSATTQQDPLTLAPNTAYTQRLEVLSGSASNFSVVPAFKDSGGTVHYNFFSNNQTTTTTDTMTCSDYNIYWGAAGRVINATFRVWLEKGSDLASPYEPYQGQEYEVNLGKNLFDKSTATQNYRLGPTGDPFADNDYYLSDFIPVVQNTAYYISGVSGNAESSAVCFYASDKSFISRRIFVNDWYAFTTPANTAFLRFTTLKTHDINSVQLELGSTATDYAPYFTPIELAKVGTYQDRIYKDDGKWYIEKQVGKVVLDGSENWSLYPNKTHTFRVGAPHTMTNAICDHFVSIPASQFDIAVGTYTTNTGVFIISYPDMADVASFKTWLASNPTTFYCADTQWTTTTEITDEALLLQLNFLASLYEGVNNISLTGTGAQGEMTVRYATDYTVNQDIITIDSQARTITLNGQDVYHLKTSESEFLVLAPGENKLYLTSEVSDDSGYAEVKFKQGYLSI